MHVLNFVTQSLQRKVCLIDRDVWFLSCPQLCAVGPTNVTQFRALQSPTRIVEMVVTAHNISLRLLKLVVDRSHTKVARTSGRTSDPEKQQILTKPHVARILHWRLPDCLHRTPHTRRFRSTKRTLNKPDVICSLHRLPRLHRVPQVRVVSIEIQYRAAVVAEVLTDLVLKLTPSTILTGSFPPDC